MLNIMFLVVSILQVPKRPLTLVHMCNLPIPYYYVKPQGSGFHSIKL